MRYLFPSNRFPSTLLKSASILLAMTMLLQYSNKVWLLIQFEAQREHIAEFLCINQDRKDFSCDGRCHLIAVMQQAEEKENHGSPLQNLKHTDVHLVYIPVSANSLFTPPCFQETESPHFTPYVFFIPASRTEDFFHPPSLS